MTKLSLAIDAYEAAKLRLIEAIDESERQARQAIADAKAARRAVKADVPAHVQCKGAAQELIEAIAQAHGVPVRALTGANRKRCYAWPRQEAMWALYETGRYSLPEIGRFLGGRDHTTVLHGVRAHARRMAPLTMQEAA